MRLRDMLSITACVMMIFGLLAVLAVLVLGNQPTTSLEAIAFDDAPVFDEMYVAPEEPQQASISARAEARSAPTSSPSVAMTDEEIRELRKWIESRNDYAYFDGRYIGAYNFALTYMEDRYNRWGLAEVYGPYSHDAFLASPQAQDAAADAYAQERYGGWQNTPRSGGW